MKNIFLSASVPLPERDPKYIDTADIIAIRDSVIALTTTILPTHKLIWGGHPSITPLINFVIEKTKRNKAEREIDNFKKLTKVEQEKIIDEKILTEISQHVTLYQSKIFEHIFPDDNNKFKNVILTDIINNDREQSLLHMRERMFSESEFSAAIFIGGMEGVEQEYNLFTEYHPDALLLPIASTGAASKIIYDSMSSDKFKNERLVSDYGYMSLFQECLMKKLQ